MLRPVSCSSSSRSLPTRVNADPLSVYIWRPRNLMAPSQFSDERDGRQQQTTADDSRCNVPSLPDMREDRQCRQAGGRIVPGIFRYSHDMSKYGNEYGGRCHNYDYSRSACTVQTTRLPGRPRRGRALPYSWWSLAVGETVILLISPSPSLLKCLLKGEGGVVE